MGSHIDKSEYEQAIANIGNLHGNMAVLSKLDRILKDYNSNLEEAEALILSDGGLAGTIIKISNSALYGFGEKSESITEALKKVGYDQTLKLVSMALSKQVFMRDLDAYGVSADSYWQYSYFTATFMEIQANRFGTDTSDAYLFGLLHSIGRVVINELLRANDIEVFWDRFIPEEVWETSMVGFTNERAGAILLKSWEFAPEMYGRIAKQSDKTFRIKDNTVSLLDYTRQLALHLDDSEKIDQLCKPNAHSYVIKTGLTSDKLIKDIQAAKSHLEEVHESLKSC